MFQLKNLINRTSVPSDPQNNMTAAEDFMLLLLHAHVVAAASTIQDEVGTVPDVTDLAQMIVVNYFLPPKL